MRRIAASVRGKENGNASDDMMPIIWIACFLPLFMVMISSGSNQSDVEESLKAVHKAEASVAKSNGSYLLASDLAPGRKITTENEDIRVYVLDADKNNFCAVGFAEDSDDTLKRLDDVDDYVYAIDKSGEVEDLEDSCADKLKKTDLSKLGFFDSKGYVRAS